MPDLFKDFKDVLENFLKFPQIAPKSKMTKLSHLRAAVPNHLGMRDGFHGRQFFYRLGGGGGEGWFGMIQVHYIYCVFYFYYYYYISFTSEHQALDHGG